MIYPYDKNYYIFNTKEICTMISKKKIKYSCLSVLLGDQFQDPLKTTKSMDAQVPYGKFYVCI